MPFESKEHATVHLPPALYICFQFYRTLIFTSSQAFKYRWRLGSQTVDFSSRLVYKRETPKFGQPIFFPDFFFIAWWSQGGLFSSQTFRPNSRLIQKTQHRHIFFLFRQHNKEEKNVINKITLLFCSPSIVCGVQLVFRFVHKCLRWLVAVVGSPTSAANITPIQTNSNLFCLCVLRTLLFPVWFFILFSGVHLANV